MKSHGHGGDVARWSVIINAQFLGWACFAYLLVVAPYRDETSQHFICSIAVDVVTCTRLGIVFFLLVTVYTRGNLTCRYLLIELIAIPRVQLCVF